MTRSTTATVMAVLLCLALMTGAQAAQDLPDYWLAIAVGGAELDAGPGAVPPTTLPNPMATVAPGGTVQLRAKVVGNRRAYMMWPETYADIGAHTVINERGFDRMSFTVDTGTFHGTGVWTVDEESYTWDTGGKGIASPVTFGATGEKINWTAPVEPGYYPITASGHLKLKYTRQAPGGPMEKSEESGKLSATFIVQVTGTPTTSAATAPVTPTPAAGDYNQAKQKVLARFMALGDGPKADNIGTYVVSAGFLNNLNSIVNGQYSDYVCGGWQAKVLQMFDDMRGGTPEERALFAQMDYGPIQAYYGGHQAVVMYPKGTDWTQTGTVLDPWPHQTPETFTMTDWKSRFWFGVGPSGPYQGQYPLTGGAAYPPLETLRIPPAHAPILRRCTLEQKRAYLALPTAAGREAYIQSLPDSVKKTTAVAVHSPVQMLLIDGQGRRVGWESPTSFLYEIPGVDVDAFPEADGTRGLLLTLPLADYQVSIRAGQAGSFTFTRALPTDTSITDVSGVQVAAGDMFFMQLSERSPAAPLIKQDGSILMLSAISSPAAPPTTPTAPATPTTPTTPTMPTMPTAPAWPTGPTTVASDAPVIVSPLPGAGVMPRAEVYGTGPAGAMIVVYTEVRAQDDDGLLKNVPGLRHKIKEDGSWHVAVSVPELPANVAEPLYYVIKAYWVTPTHKSQEASVRVQRQ